ncbi:hypothetical protein CQA49_00010 [Helicobacter sp. MIT 00-7814]|uniref:Panacea domain-containing protein n=1 Tax=unclassified Helicobacter TaxID=2593540 RepID=UPI000E1F218A|nr:MULTISPECIES: Panacea domain-containing protein [unclassified Helicobacter]RDU57088.1 hypothetical protein CQA49_00010 [Helicobacter sp. MIT 00-7814]RDU57639.1 hypothetical protein CQA37_00010 [Helicobacter sp. MIT 99-10781]
MNKTKEAIIYIIDYFQKNFAPKDLGKVKLNKILWFANRAYMYKHYETITPNDFIKNPRGPVVKGLDKILKELEANGEIHSFNIQKGDFIQQSFTTAREANLNIFTAAEISVIDETINQYAKSTAKDLSDESHDESWEATKDGDVLLVESVFLQDIQKATLDNIDAN